MSPFLKLSNFIACKIALTLDMDKNHEEVIAYGAFNIIQTVWSILLIIILGWVFDVALEALIISFVGATLRKYSGGAHATSPNRCAMIGAIIFVGIAVFVEKMLLYMNTIQIIILITLSFIFTYYTIYKYAPVDTPTKPIKKQEKIQLLRKGALRTIYISLTIVIVLVVFFYQQGNEAILKYAVCISMGLMWQALTLVFLGHFIINRLDSFLKILVRGRGGEK